MTGYNPPPPSPMVRLQLPPGKIDVTRLSVEGTKVLQVVAIPMRSYPRRRRDARAAALRIRQGSSFALPVAFHSRAAALGAELSACQAPSSVQNVVFPSRKSPYLFNPHLPSLVCGHPLATPLCIWP